MRTVIGRSCSERVATLVGDNGHPNAQVSLCTRCLAAQEPANDMQIGGLTLVMDRMEEGTVQMPSPAISPEAAAGTYTSTTCVKYLALLLTRPY